MFVVMIVGLLPACVQAAVTGKRPAILFVVMNGRSMWHGDIDFTYLKELNKQGFEVDYTRDIDECRALTWERIRKYNVVVLTATPNAYSVYRGKKKPDPALTKSFVDMMERFVRSGGGVFLFPREHNWHIQQVSELTDRWGAQIPAEQIIESDAARRATMTRMSYVPVFYTDQVADSPVSKGVSGIWYPMTRSYDNYMTGPIVVDKQWQVVVRGSKTTTTRAIPIKRGGAAAMPSVLRRTPGVTQPTLFAIRTVDKGRVALINQWSSFTFGAGTMWMYNREILETGYRSKASDMGRLVTNTYRWLAGPSLKSNAVGGYVTPPNKLTPDNLRPGAKAVHDNRMRSGHYERMQRDLLKGTVRHYRGLFGARTAYSSGTGTVADYARAAKQANLDFIVFMEDYDRMNPADFDKLKADCGKHSGQNLMLYPGYAMKTNIGNFTFFYGTQLPLPPAKCLAGPNKKLFNVQIEDGSGGYTGRISPYLTWVLQEFAVAGVANVGYYNFGESGKGLKLKDLRCYSMAAIRYYRTGKLVEDVTEQFLLTAECTIPPMPVVVNEVRSPAEMKKAVASRQSLTYAGATGLDKLFETSLRWANTYDSHQIYTSNGPRIKAWPWTTRIMTFGEEEFSDLGTAITSTLWVTSDVGLKSITVYNGRKLYRRFLPGGKREFKADLMLDATVQKNMFAVAEDVRGRKAVSAPRRSWKEQIGISYCSDHVNSGTMLSNHGPSHYSLVRLPDIPVCIRGGGWDGGPRGIVPVVTAPAIPRIQTDAGTEDGQRFNQTPILEFTDEGARVVNSLHDEVFDKRLKKVVNAWWTNGPIEGPSKLFAYNQRYRDWARPAVGVTHIGWVAPRVPEGILPALYTTEFTFRKDMTVKRLRMAWHDRVQGDTSPVFVLGTAGKPRVFDLKENPKGKFTLPHGAWYGYYAPEASNTVVFFNRGKTLELELIGDRMKIYAASPGKPVKAGDRYDYKVFALAWPVTVPVKGVADITRVVDYLMNPTGFEVVRGKRIKDVGVIDLAQDAGVVEFRVPKPARRVDLTLPVRVKGLNTRWSAGLFMKTGYVMGGYGTGKNRYRALGIDFDGNAYVPVYVDYADLTHMVAGHPVVADEAGKELFIQVTRLQNSPFKWHVSVNNPTDEAVTATLRKSMDLPQLKLDRTTVTLKPGEYRVLE